MKMSRTWVLALALVLLGACGKNGNTDEGSTPEAITSETDGYGTLAVETEVPAPPAAGDASAVEKGNSPAP
jgi:hypothetical protein